MIYLDSSALMKLVRREAETEPLTAWLALHHEQSLVSSELARIEVLRAARRAGEAAVAEARMVIGDLDLMPMHRAVQDVACDAGDPLLRSLDAVHLASALVLGTLLTCFVAYDRRLIDAARAAGLVVATPGQE